NTIEALVLEDIGFVKRVTDREPSLEFHGMTFTFWDDHTLLEKGESYSATEYFWNTDEHRSEIIQKIKDITSGSVRDTHSLRKHIRLDRFLLTSRGYELASVLFEGFYDLLTQKDLSERDDLGAFAANDTQKFVLEKWAAQFSALGCVVVMNERVNKTVLPDGGNTVSRTVLHPKHVFDSKQQSWISC
ncbi:MAG: hypothetical protein ABJO27_27145, partial [Pseudoruegeria sp.]